VCLLLQACEKFPSEYGTIIDAVKAVLEEKLRKNAAITKDAAKSEKIDQAVTAQVQKMNEVALKSIQSIIFSNMIFGNLSLFPSEANKIHPDSRTKLLWDVLMFAVLVYYSIVIPLRIALDLDPSLFIADYVCDVISILDSYLYFTVFALFSAGQLQTKSADIQANFKATRMAIDIVAALPYDLLALCFMGYHGDTFLLIRAALRLPKLAKLLLASNYFKQVELLCKESRMDPVLFRFTEINFNILIFSHWVACIFFCFAEFGQRQEDCDHTVRNKYYGYACQYRATWVMQQIASLKLPLDGGTQWDRYVRAYNWALPNLVVRTMGEVWVMNANEVILAVIMFFFGLSISGMIIGNVMSIVSGASQESTKMFRDIEVLQAYLKSNHVPEALINTAIALLRHQGSTEGALTLNQESILSDLPYSIQLAVDTHVKTLPFLRKCPFFDFYTDEVLREISSKLRVNMYVKDDHVVTYGDLGYEMFFLESGIVHVVSADQKTRYSTLEDGAFFGETAMFFNTIRTATILVASPFCVCLTLRKGDFDAILRNSEFEEEQVLESFKALQMMNQKRNAAVTANLIRAADPTSKLYKLIKLSETGPAKTSVLQQLRQHLHPDSTFRAVWDCAGFLLLVYYIFSIPLYAAFMFDAKLDMYLRFMALDFLIDAYWFVDILLKAYVFSFKLNMFHDRIVTDGEAILTNYQKNGHFWYDIVASIPLEMVVITPGIRRITILICRLIHLFRVPQVFNYADLVEHHLQKRCGVQLQRALVLLIKAFLFMVIMNHWLACGFFCYTSVLRARSSHDLHDHGW
jgi:voltage-gated potassium channel